MRVFVVLVLIIGNVTGVARTAPASVPTASFTSTTVCQGLPTVFTNTSSTLSGSIVASIWDFGDGHGSTVFSPQYTYPASGTFSVTLTVINSQGEVGQHTASVVVHPSGTPNFVINDASLCADQVFTFTNLSSIVSGSFTSYSWDFGDGETSSSTNTTHEYASPGTYTVTLTTTSDNNCTNSVSKVVEVFPLATASFTATTVCMGAETIFTNQSHVASGLIEFDWTFGDGNSSGEINPSYEYATAGSHTVNLTATTDKGCVSATTATVVVNPRPTADFSVTDHCFGEDAVFENLSSVSAGTLSHVWEFGDGTNSTDEDGLHVYAATGNYQVTLKVTTNQGCEASASKFVRSTPKPIVNFSVNNICLGQEAAFINASTITEGQIAYVWDFGDGEASAVTNPSHPYQSAGTYDITLTASTALGGCPQSITKQIEVSAQPMASFEVEDNCLDSIFVFSNTSAYDGADITYTWSFGDGESYVGYEPSHQYAFAQTYTVQLSAVAGNGCADTETKTLRVAPLPQINFIPDDVCFGEEASFKNFSSIASGTLTYEWDFGDGTSADGFEPSHDYSQDGEYIVTLRAVSDLGCAALKSKSTHVYPLPVANFSAASVCDGESVAFTNESTIASGTILAYAWDFGDESTSVIRSPSKGYLSPGDYVVTMKAVSGFGCESAIEKTVTVHPLPLADFSVGDVCAGGPVEIANLSVIESGSLTYEWDFGDMNTSVATSPSHEYAQYGVYTITLSAISDYGCEDSFSRPVAIFSAPEVNAGEDRSVSQGYAVQLLATGAATYRWEPIEGLNNSSIPDPIATPLVTTDYVVFGKNTFGCENSDTVRVSVMEEFRLVATNVLTPDENGSNDTWQIENVETFGDVNVRVYDRTGRLVFQKEGYQNDWRGTTGKDLLPDGTYYYYVTFGNSDKVYKGSLTLLRNQEK